MKRFSRNSEYIYGYHSVLAALKYYYIGVLEIFLLQGRDDERVRTIAQLAKELGLSCQWASKTRLDAMVNSAVHQGFVARIKALQVVSEQQLMTDLERQQQQAFILVFEGIQDVHNLGACVRTCVAAGVKGIVFTKHNRASITPAVVKVSSGTVFQMPVYQTSSIARLLKQLHQCGVRSVGTVAEQGTCSSLYQADLTGPLALVIGSEEKGLKRLTQQTCDTLVSIPMHGMVDSLNLSVSVGVCVYEAVRQRQLKTKSIM